MSDPDFAAYLARYPGAARAWARVLAIRADPPTIGICAAPLDAESDDPNGGGWLFDWGRDRDSLYVDLEVPAEGPVEWFVSLGGDRYAGGGDESGVRFALALVGRDAALRAEGAAQERERIAAALDREADEMVDLTKKGLHSPLNAFLRDRAFYARDLAEGLRAGTWPQPALFGGG